MEVLENDEKTLVNSDLPMTQTENFIYERLSRRERNKIKHEFNKKVKKGLLVKVMNNNGDEGYVTKADFIKNRNLYK